MRTFGYIVVETSSVALHLMSGHPTQLLSLGEDSFPDPINMIRRSRHLLITYPSSTKRPVLVVILERLMGVEPTSLAWKASIIAVIRQPQNFVHVTFDKSVR